MRRLTGDEGAVAVMVALLLPIVLLGFGALVLDVGSLYAEKRQLQNGADAGALAIADTCSEGACGTPTSVAQLLADGNANDGAANVEEVCGYSPTQPAALTPCASPPAIPAGAGYVRVKTRTGSLAGPGLMPPLLARALDPTYDGSTVSASAIAVWGKPGSLRAVLPLTFSACEYNLHTVNQTAFSTAPYSPLTEVKIYFHGDSAPVDCKSSPTSSGLDLPGGFGWIDVAGCTSSTTLSAWIPEDPGAAVPQDCTTGNGQNAIFAFDALVGTTIQLPVFGLTSGSGENGQYQIVDYASFHLTGFFFDQQHQRVSTVTNVVPCAQPNSCVSGYFVRSDVDPETSSTVGGGVGGVTVVQLLS